MSDKKVITITQVNIKLAQEGASKLNLPSATNVADKFQSICNVVLNLKERSDGLGQIGTEKSYVDEFQEIKGKGKVNDTNLFVIYTRTSGQLSVEVAGPGRAFMEIKEQELGYIDLTLIFRKEGSYRLCVKLNGHEVAHSPLVIIIEPEEILPKLDMLSITGQIEEGTCDGKYCSVKVNITGQLPRTTDFDGFVMTPSFCRRPLLGSSLMNHNELHLRFATNEIGLHEIYCFCNSFLINKIPFLINLQ